MLLLLLLGEKMGKGKGRCGEEASLLAGRFLGLLVGDSPLLPRPRRLSDWVRILGSGRAYCSSKFVAIKESPIDRFYSRIDLASGYDVIDLRTICLRLYPLRYNFTTTSTYLD